MPDPETPPVPWTPTNFLALPPEQSSLDSAAAVLIPAPIDSTTSFRTGARHGPAAIIAASAALEDYDIELNVDVAGFGIHTAPPLEPHVGAPYHMVERIRFAVTHYAARGSGKLTGVIGGDHSASIGSAFAQLDRNPNLSVLYIDAHADLRDEYQGTRWGHGSGARRIAERCPISLVGVRTLAPEERQYIDERRVPVCYWPSEKESDLDDIIAGLGSDVYISVDLDVLDPAEMPAVGTPEPGGMRWLELTGILRSVCQARRVVGFDVCELAPDQGLPAHSYTAAKLIYKLIAYALALSPH